jgi:tetratricopeptide (TPR) repeat protein
MNSKLSKENKMKYKIPFILFLSLMLTLCASTQQKLQKQRAQDPQYQYNIGLVYLQNGNFAEATKYFNKALALRPNYYLALNALGLTNFMQGEFQNAAGYFEKCLQVNPGFSEARNYLGSVYQELGMLDRAEEEYRKAIADETYKSRELPYYNLARLYLAQDKNEEALQLVEKSIEINSRMVMAINLKGIVLERLGRIKDAIESYRKALRINPEDINLNYNLAVAYFKADRREDAKAIFEKIYPQVTDKETRDKINEYLKVLK